MTDLIISACTNYGWDHIKYWANSIDRCGFKGDRAMIVYNCQRETVDRLTDLGFKVWAFQRDQQGNFVWPGQLVIVVQRFFHFWQYLGQFPQDHYRYVITTDCKDVIFQHDPSKWLEEHLGGKQMVASCESLCYQHEPWGMDNLAGSYPWLTDRMKARPIWNCGVQAGTMRVMADLWLSIWHACHAAQRHNPDQAAYNVLLDSFAYQSITRFAMSEDGWACQAGTTVDPTKMHQFRAHLLEPEPLWTGSRATTSKGEEFAIVHQWDRIPAWKDSIERAYG